MKKEKKLIEKLTKMVVKLPMKISEKQANTTCHWLAYQAEEPKNLKKLRKF